mgnify:CR=1 FL=1
MLDAKHILDELSTCMTEEALQNFHATYMGKKWKITWLYKEMKDLSPEERKTQGQKIQELFQAVEKEFFAKQDFIKKEKWDKELRNEPIDITTPVNKTDKWSLTLLSQTRRKVEEIFQGMWFHVDYGHHKVSVHENFTSVNIPLSHPATEMHDTLYLNEKDDSGKNFLMRTHTSAHQNELIKKLGTPCKFIVPGKVYRNEKMDASHDCVFRQIEWVVIDKWISVAHFKSMIHRILEAILETDEVELRMRPAYFPFVEPGMEIDAKYQLKGKDSRLEILGAGMIHPNVLEQAGVDPHEYSGFAFGLGMTRLVAIKYGINDIRLLTNGDVRFAKSFG